MTAPAVKSKIVTFTEDYSLDESKQPDIAPALSAEEWERHCRYYMRLKAGEQKLKAKLDVERDLILPELRRGRKSPRDLPFILVLQQRFRTLADWKEALKRELIVWFKNEAQAEQRMKDIQAGFPAQESEALCVEINKAFQAKL